MSQFRVDGGFFLVSLIYFGKESLLELVDVLDVIVGGFGLVDGDDLVSTGFFLRCGVDIVDEGIHLFFGVFPNVLDDDFHLGVFPLGRLGVAEFLVKFRYDVMGKAFRGLGKYSDFAFLCPQAPLFGLFCVGGDEEQGVWGFGVCEVFRGFGDALGEDARVLGSPGALEPDEVALPVCDEFLGVFNVGVFVGAEFDYGVRFLGEHGNRGEFGLCVFGV